MNNAKLSSVLYEHADKIQAQNFADRLDTAELIRVLARLVDGKPIERAFGAPRDWGYGTPIGDALAAKG